MNSFDFTVPTDPMADSMNVISRHVDQTTGAVVVMQKGVIAAEERSAKFISDNVNLGFATLIHSQISQRKVKAESQLTAKLMEIAQHLRALQQTRSQLERDYHRISGRYTKLFGQVDDSLRLGIQACSREAVLLADDTTAELERREFFLGAATPVQGQDNLPQTQILTAEVLRRSAGRAMDRMLDFISNRIGLKRTTASMLQQEEVADAEAVFVPVLLVEADHLALDGTQKSMLAAGSSGTVFQQAAATLGAAARETEATATWGETPKEKIDAIKNACAEKIQSSNLDERVKKKMLELINVTEWQQMEASA